MQPPVSRVPVSHLVTTDTWATKGPHPEFLENTWLMGRHFPRVWATRSQLRTGPIQFKREGATVLSHRHLSELCFLSSGSLLPPPHCAPILYGNSRSDRIIHLLKSLQDFPCHSKSHLVPPGPLTFQTSSLTISSLNTKLNASTGPLYVQFPPPGGSDLALAAEGALSSTRPLLKTRPLRRPLLASRWP